MNREPLRAPRARSLLALVATLMIALGVTGVSTGTAWAAPGAQGCESQGAALDAVNAEIDRHNAQPHTFTLPQQQAAYDAYNAEAAQLNARAAQAKTNLQSCAVVIRTLTNGEKLHKPTQRQVEKINAGKEKLPPNYVPPAPSPRTPSGTVSVAPPMQPVFKPIRENPKWRDDLTLQGKPRPAVGDPNPANGAPLPAVKNDPSRAAVTVDHIVPLAQLMYMPGFLQLPAEYMYMVAHSTLNLQWMPIPANSAKNSDSAARISGADPQWIDEQLQLEQDTREKLQELIDQLLATIPATP